MSRHIASSRKALIKKAEPKLIRGIKKTTKAHEVNSSSSIKAGVRSRVGASHRPLRAIVGIGASAGGLEALTSFLKNLSKNTGMAYVYVQHLDPTHESMLAMILRRVSPIPVKEATNGARVMPNTLYVIPPNKRILISKSTLRLASRVRGSTGLVSIDNFFCSLAEDQKGLRIGIILSGNASDGSRGLKTIKDEGGITFAQQEDSAKYPSMPHNAIAEGNVDYVLTPQNIAKEMERISHHSHVASPLFRAKAELFDNHDEKTTFDKILSLLSARHGVNFLQYKPMTLKRRISRRMVLHKMETLPEYFDYLQKNPIEVVDLYQDMLINVTQFFRDKEVFAYIEKKIIPEIVKSRAKDEPIRIWVAGCSTGEEVYSYAIAIVDYLEKKKLHIPLQIFGSDLSESCIERARHGIYPLAIGADVSKDRLQRFFVESEGNYQVSRTIREMCVFAKQNIVNDPPFSHVDLISCRNVLIYLDQSAQKRIIPMFHYALRPIGFLVLGKYEGIGEFSDLFAMESKSHRVFSKKPSSHPPRLAVQAILKGRFADKHVIASPVAVKDPKDIALNSALNEVNQAILASSFAPAAVVVDASDEVLQLRGDLSFYLKLPSGRATMNLLKIAREDLLIELRSTLSEAKREDHAVFARDINMMDLGRGFLVDIEVSPLK